MVPNWSLVKKLILESHLIVITTHLNPDADGLGSQLALALGLKKLGKKVICLNEEKLPQRYQYLNKSRTIKSVSEIGSRWEKLLKEKIDLLMVVDSNSELMIGKRITKIFDGAANKIFIDHHPAPLKIFRKHCIDTSSAATGELVAKILNKLKIPITVPMSLSLYTAILIDTSSFRYPSVQGNTHRILGQLLDSGLNPARAYNHIYGEKKIKHLHLLGEVLSGVQIDSTGLIAWISIKKKQILKTKISSEDTHYFINHLLVLKGIKVVCLFRETEGYVKVSFRSTLNPLEKKPFNVGEMAFQLGGGGHIHAAATQIKGSLPKVIKKTIKDIQQILRKENFPKISLVP
jgi:phosphoesterase RecJ-like protein